MEMQALWDQACAFMRSEMTQITYDTWIKTALRPLGVSGGLFYVEAVTNFFHEYVVPRYSALISNALTQAAGRPLTAKLLNPAQADEYRAGIIPEKASGRGDLNPKYTFDSFVQGSNNKFALAAAIAVACAAGFVYLVIQLFRRFYRPIQENDDTQEFIREEERNEHRRIHKLAVP